VDGEIVDTTIEDSRVEGYVNCADAPDAVALAGTSIPVPMEWSYVSTTPAYRHAQEVGR
jgi:hypothetical protein